MNSRIKQIETSIHLILVLGVVLSLFKINLGEILIQLGALTISLYYIWIEVKSAKSISLFHKSILVLIPAIVIVFTLQGLNFIFTIALLALYSFLKGSFENQKVTE
ncbi:MAG: hypothetical protein JSS79_16195 [Bacteroidetes bacterium]|nr:hypothetical protein [Bacteroidota bacterium]